METAFDILHRTRQYLDGKLSLHEIENWVVHHLDELLSEPGTTPYELAGAIELGLAELSAGNIDEDQLRSDIQSLLAHGSVIFRVGTVAAFTATANSTMPEFGIRIPIGVIPPWSRGSTEHVRAS